VNPTRSQKSVVTTFRSSVGGKGPLGQRRGALRAELEAASVLEAT
jgi:hypothetical protein